MDETTLSLHPPLRACWMKRGQQKRVPTPGRAKGRKHLFGAYDWQTDTVCAQLADQCNSEAFIAFLEYLFIRCYPTEPCVLVMDNSPIHKSYASLAALSLFEHRVLIIWLPIYCSTLNPIERYWRHLKDFVCVNKLFPDLDALAVAIDQQLQAQNDPTNHDRFSFSKF